jgi:hypothetical protein
MRWLLAAVVVMGVLILGGTAVLIAMVVGGAHGTAAPAAVTLDEPAGTRIVGVTGLQNRLAVQLSGGGPDRVAVVDLPSGRTTLRIGLAH